MAGCSLVVRVFIAAATLAITAAGVVSPVFAAPLDEGVWPSVVPEFTPGPSAMQKRGVHIPVNNLSTANCQLPTNRFAKPAKADVRMVAGAPQFHIDGKPFFALWGGVRQFKRPDGLPHHSSAPLSVVTVLSYTTRGSSCNEWWPSENGFDPAIFDRQAALYCRENPDAYFMWDLVCCFSRFTYRTMF